MAEQVLHVKPLGLRIALWAFLVVIFITALSLFGIIDFTPFIIDVLVIASILFAYVEASVVQLIRRKKKADVLSLITMLVASFVLLSWVLGLFDVAFFTQIQGLGVAILFVVVLMESIRK